MITDGPAPRPVEQTDVNPRCDRCGCAPHTAGKCPNRWCGCLQNRSDRQAVA